MRRLASAVGAGILVGAVLVTGGGTAGASGVTFTSTQVGSSGSTPVFSMTGPWSMQWSFQGCGGATGTASTGNFAVTVNTPSADTHSDPGPDELARSGSGTDHYYDAGSFNLSVLSTCSWSITVSPTASGDAALPATFSSTSAGSTGSTQEFHMSGKWTMHWTYSACPGGSGNFAVQVEQLTGGLSDDVGPDELGSGASGTDTYTNAGTFNLDVLSECAWSVVVAGPTAPPGKPGKPVAIPEFKKAQVSWAKDAVVNGTPITRYTVTSSTGRHHCAPTTLAAPSCIVSGLANGLMYTFTVKAHNARGTSTASAPSNAVKPEVEKPARPTSPEATASESEATLTWTAATAEGAPITRYVATSTTRRHGCTWTKGPLTCKVGGLTGGQTYKFSIVAHNAKGTSAASPLSAAVTPAILLAPLLLQASQLPSGYSARSATGTPQGCATAKAFAPSGVGVTGKGWATFLAVTTTADIFEYLATYATPAATVFGKVTAATLACHAGQVTVTGATIAISADTPTPFPSFGQQSEAFLQTVSAPSLGVTLDIYHVVVRAGTVLIGISTLGLTITAVEPVVAAAVGDVQAAP